MKRDWEAVFMTQPNWLKRYESGEREAVWSEMTALGANIRKAPYFDEARAVAQLTMRRARHNVELIIRRLDELKYHFWDGEQGSLGPQTMKMCCGGKIIEYPSIEAAAQEAMKINPWRNPSEGSRKHVLEAQNMLATLLGKFQEQNKVTTRKRAEARKKKAAITDHLTDASVFSRPDSDEISRFRELEKKGMILPLSLCAWIEEVGDVNLAGSHPALSFWQDANFPGVHADPLMVSIDGLMFELEGWEEQVDDGGDAEELSAVIGYDAEAKSRLAVENEQLDYGYTIDLPNGAADAPLRGESHNTTFVNYLRIAFKWGGFPGWEHQANRPELELKKLTEGLLEI
jgi:hypothetical protein